MMGLFYGCHAVQARFVEPMSVYVALKRPGQCNLVYHGTRAKCSEIKLDIDANCLFEVAEGLETNNPDL